MQGEKRGAQRERKLGLGGNVTAPINRVAIETGMDQWEGPFYGLDSH
jgi:hypothetical protein